MSNANPPKRPEPTPDTDAPETAAAPLPYLNVDPEAEEPPIAMAPDQWIPPGTPRVIRFSEIDPDSYNARWPEAQHGFLVYGDQISTDEIGFHRLKQSIAAVGILQPPHVMRLRRARHGVRYRLIFGFRRSLAWWELHDRRPETEIRVIVHPPLTEAQILAIQLNENFHREPMSFYSVIKTSLWMVPNKIMEDRIQGEFD
ncbi:ParB/RepB/Spo0J family partition protein [Sulfobacillus thermosulfidooxidans]|uniref:ParB/RepB/Spo0J family partition protein n=1 Tax=Sulfobacillus thermosulfidooxidans TaxID=28034 RepID=UPI0006B48A71|nr:ParB N-terminal domain-containing protein [Sulfobacillus thermosulfidooxidans]